jgi:hypothetical protein
VPVAWWAHMLRSPGSKPPREVLPGEARRG